MVPLFPPFSLTFQPRRYRRVWRHTTRVGLLRRLRLLFSFHLFVCFPSGVTPDSPLLFLSFQSPRSLRIDCRQSLSGLFLPLSVPPARPRRTFGYTVGWSFSARGFRRFPFCCYWTSGYRRIPFSFTPFLSFPGLSPDLSLFPFPWLWVPTHSLVSRTWSARGSSSRWFHTATSAWSTVDLPTVTSWSFFTRAIPCIVFGTMDNFRVIQPDFRVTSSVVEKFAYFRVARRRRLPPAHGVSSWKDTPPTS